MQLWLLSLGSIPISGVEVEPEMEWLSVDALVMTMTGMLRLHTYIHVHI